MSPLLNWSLAWIATAIGVAEVLSWLPRTLLVALVVISTAVITWALLCQFGIRQQQINAAVVRRRRELGY